jgi:hypothetical protein
MSDIGDTLTFKSDLFDKPAEQGGVLTNATSVVLTVTLPDGTTATPAVTNPPSVTGKYTATYVASTQSGRYLGKWLFTLPGSNTTSYVETFDVGSSLVTIDEAVAHLRAAGVVTSEPDLEQLQWLCFVASEAIERDLGRVIAQRTVVEVYDGGRPQILLQSTPVISVTTVVENGITLAATDYILRRAGWILQRGTTTARWPWAYGWGNVTVTYRAGYLDPPRIARKVALNGIQRMFQESQQASHPFLDNVSADAAVFVAAGTLTPLEMGAYESLKALNFA